MNDQRMVDVELLRQILRLAGNTPDYEEYQAPADKLRAIIDGPGVEPVGEIMLGESDGVEVDEWDVEWNTCAIDLINETSNDRSPRPLYLAAPSAPVPSDDQGPFDKSRLKRLVTQVFGEGWQIVPPSAPAHNETAELCAWRSRFQQFEYRPQDECVALRVESDKPSAPVQVVPDTTPHALIKRLRDTPNWRKEAFGLSWKDMTTSFDRAPFEAADEIEKLLNSIAIAYGYLWHVNNDPDAPWTYSPERAAREARKILRDLISNEDRGRGINVVRETITEHAPKPPKEIGE